MSEKLTFEQIIKSAVLPNPAEKRKKQTEK